MNDYVTGNKNTSYFSVKLNTRALYNYGVPVSRTLNIFRSKLPSWNPVYQKFSVVYSLDILKMNEFSIRILNLNIKEICFVNHIDWEPPITFTIEIEQSLKLLMSW